MKKGQKLTGKTYTLTNTYPNVSFLASTVNFKELKSIQIETRFWIEKDEAVDTKKLITNTFRECKRTLFQKGGFYDVDKIISIADYPNDLTTKTSKVFIMFEFTIFPTIKFEDDTQIVMLLTELVDEMYKKAFEGKQNILKSKREPYYV